MPQGSIRRSCDRFATRARPGSNEWGVPALERDSVVLATHEAAAHAIESGESGGTVDVTASRDGEGVSIVHVRSDGVWEAACSPMPPVALCRFWPSSFGDVDPAEKHRADANVRSTALISRYRRGGARQSNVRTTA